MTDKKEISFKSLLSEKQYLKNLAGATITRFGDGIDTIAFAWLIYEITGSKSLLAITFGVSGLPNLIFGMFSGVITSYFPKKNTIFLCDILRGSLALTISILYFSGNVTTFHILLVTFLNSTLESFRHPPSISIMPLILKEEKIDLGLSFNASLTNASQVLGIAISPILLSVFGIGGALIIDSITFFICGIIVFSLKYKDDFVNSKKLTLKSGISDFKDGFKVLLGSKFFINLCIFAAIVNALFVPISSFSPAYVADLGLGPEGISILETPLLIAMTVFALFVPKLKSKFGGKNIFILGGFILGVVYCFFSVIHYFNFPEIYVLLALGGFIMGGALITINIPIQIAITTKIDKEYLMRLTSILGSLTQGVTPIAAFILGGVVEFITIEQLFLIFGIITSIIFLLQIFNKNLDELN